MKLNRAIQIRNINKHAADFIENWAIGIVQPRYNGRCIVRLHNHKCVPVRVSKVKVSEPRMRPFNRVKNSRSLLPHIAVRCFNILRYIVEQNMRRIRSIAFIIIENDSGTILQLQPIHISSV
ncbi:hypothetical protein D3C80_1628330 [compost metagenome]